MKRPGVWLFVVTVLLLVTATAAVPASAQTCPATEITVDAGTTLMVPSECTVSRIHNYGSVVNYGTVSWRVDNYSNATITNHGSIDFLFNGYYSSDATGINEEEGNIRIVNNGYYGGGNNTFTNYGSIQSAGNGFYDSGNNTFTNYGTLLYYINNGYRSSLNTFTNYGIVDGYVYNGSYSSGSGNVATNENGGSIYWVRNGNGAGGDANTFTNYGTVTGYLWNGVFGGSGNTAINEQGGQVLRFYNGIEDGSSNNTAVNYGTTDTLFNGVYGASYNTTINYGSVTNFARSGDVIVTSSGYSYSTNNTFDNYGDIYNQWC